MPILPVIFDIDMDAIGGRNPITLPATGIWGRRRLIIKPPTGHAWTYYPALTGGVGFTFDVDVPYVLDRVFGQPAFVNGETVGWCDLDSGTGTGKGSLT